MKSYELLLVESGPVYESERLILRAVDLSDADDMFEYTSDPEVTTFITLDTQQHVEETRNGIAMYFLSTPLGKFAIQLKESGKMIGTIDLRIDTASKSAEIGYALNKTYQGYGYMTEAAKLILMIGFDVLELEVIHSKHATLNPSSGKVMQRIGMVSEGILKGREVLNGEIIDMEYYSISRLDYLEKK